MKLRIYLADLTHNGMGSASDAFPLNIGLVASFAKKNLENDVEITLFKHPEDLLQGLRNFPPDILGCSNYTWNCNLSYHFTQLAKSLNPDILTIWGGTNYPFTEEPQKNFLVKRPDLDVHLYYEGEQAFSNILKKRLSVSSPSAVFQDPIPGSHFISPTDGSFILGPELPRIKNLDEIPSPYTTGLMDKFFDGVKTPMVETARGCPFLCNFCNAGDSYFNQVNKFSDDYVREEFTYIARKASAASVRTVMIADNNFGMIPRDFKTSELLFHLQEKYCWPMSILLFTGKNAKERVISSTKLLGQSLSVTMSVQSMDDKVLENIKRQNISLDVFRAIIRELDIDGRPQLVDIITPLPGETLETQLKGIDSILETGATRVLGHTLQMLYGTPYRDDQAFLNQHQYLTKYRLVIRDFSNIEGKPIFDVERVGVSTKDMSFDDYLEVRTYLLILELSLSSGIFLPLAKYLKQYKIKRSEWIRCVYLGLNRLPQELSEVFQSFRNETINELWDSEEALVNHYSKPENYEKLLTGEKGGNILYRHRIMVLSEMPEAWIDFVLQSAVNLLRKKTKDTVNGLLDEMKALRCYMVGTSMDLYAIKTLGSSLQIELSYDIPAWLADTSEGPLKYFKFKEPVTFSFYFKDEDRCVWEDGFNRFGTEINGIVRMLQQHAGLLPIRSVSCKINPVISRR